MPIFSRLLSILILVLVIGNAVADHGERVRLGVLQLRGPEVARATWTPLTQYLSERLPGTHFEVIPLDYAQLKPVVERAEVDFILTAAGQYVGLELAHGVTRIATLKNTGPRGEFSEYGGVIVTRANNADIQNIGDLRGKKLLIPDETSFGGWLMQWRELRALHLDPSRDLTLVKSGNNEKVFVDLLADKGDAASARSDVLERMVRDGKLKLEDFRLLRFDKAARDYPYWTSTRLYPDWPFAKLRHTSDALAERVLVALLQLPREHAAAKAAEIVGFTVPKDYESVHALYRELELGPYAHRHLNWRDLLEHYYAELLVAAAVLLVLLQGIAVYIGLSNRRLSRENTDRRRAEAALTAEKQRADSYLETVGSMIVVLAPDGRITLANRRTNEVLGHDEGELEGQDWFKVVAPPDTSPVHRDLFDRVLAGDRTAGNGEFEVMTGDGRRRLIAWTIRPTLDAAGAANGLIAAGEDITEKRASEAELRLLAQVFAHSAEGVMICDRRMRIEKVNVAFSEITGFTIDEALGQTPRMLSSGRQSADFYHRMWRDIAQHGRWQGEIWNRRKNGEIYPEWLSISTLTDVNGDVLHYVGIFSDISRSKADEAKIHFLAYYDPLTNLPNRRLLGDRFEQSLAHARRHNRQLALLVVDLDRFKQINDSLGHHVGDRLLEGVAERFRECVRDSDTLARIGGDEFVLMLPDAENGEDAAAVSLKCIAALRTPFAIEGNELQVSPSIGIALCPQDGDTLEALIKAADTAMYAAKDAGRATYRFFTGDMNARVFARMLLENQLRRALELNQFVLHYQPQLDVASNRVIGVEALIRWNHPDQGLVFPGFFISVAEECGLIAEIGRWVVNEACRQMAQWHAEGKAKITVAVNVAAPQFRTADFYEQITGALQASGLDARYLELELTESILVEDVDDTLRLLDRFKALGVNLSVDDFGTGYSSLSYLKRFPVDRLKIDQSFVRGLTEDEDDRAIVGSIVAMGKNLKLRVLAEGVETAEHLAILRAEGCDEYQGYLFSKPLPTDQLSALLGAQTLP